MRISPTRNTTIVVQTSDLMNGILILVHIRDVNNPTMKPNGINNNTPTTHSSTTLRCVTRRIPNATTSLENGRVSMTISVACCVSSYTVS
mmetsp:Transcript_24293/g.57536  ORF Transcript_24293/g.57536 Transcript_24293/m.57536 type:complete len:90 (-) Transcript_24293:56-325(-)